MNQSPSPKDGTGLLDAQNNTADNIADALRKRREKLAQTKIGLVPDAEDEDSDG